jgi:hypothetical protein
MASISVHAAAGVDPRHADAGIGLVDRSVGGDPQVVFRPPLAGAERGRAVIAGLRVDLVEDDHAFPSARAVGTGEIDADDDDATAMPAGRRAAASSCWRSSSRPAHQVAQADEQHGDHRHHDEKSEIESDQPDMIFLFRREFDPAMP